MTINKVTKLYDANICEELIQEHIDIQNNDGWYLISVDSIRGWYRFFWAKDIT
jgi:hypothetical protein